MIKTDLVSSENTSMTIRRQEASELTTIMVTQTSTAQTNPAQTNSAQTNLAQTSIIQALTSKRNSLGMKKKHRDKCPVRMSI